MQLAVDSIRTDGGTQSRAQINWLTVTDYAADIAEGATFPPVVVYFDGADYWLADGFHRLEAHKRLGLAEIAADVKPGTRRDAILYSVKANAIHGLRRTFNNLVRQVATGEVVRSMTGHVTEAMTEHYSHVELEEKRRAVATVFRDLATESGRSGGRSAP